MAPHLVALAPAGERRYAIHDVIGAGGMATVHLGRLLGPMGFSRTVAIKRLQEQCARDPEFRAMFLDEGRIASRIHHPNVVPTIDVVYMDGELLLVMEYVHGESLAKLLKMSDEPMPLDVAVAIGVGMLHGLHAAHTATGEKGEPLDIVHRDVSPQNVLVGADGVPRVMDFGVAKAAGQLHTTREGQLKGKMRYMAPEQLRSGKTSAASDVWSASVVIWEMLAGVALFEGVSDSEVYGRVLYDPIARAREPTLEEILARGLERFPEKRWASARDMALAMEEAVTPATASRVAAWVESLASSDLASRAGMLAAIESQPASRVLVRAGENAKPRSLVIPIAIASLLGISAVAAIVAVRSRPAPVAVVAPPPSSEPEPEPEPSSASPLESAPAAVQSGAKPKPAAARPRPRPSSSADNKRCYTVDSSGIWHVKPECL
jgi:serine/threonine-protein kinase